MKKISKLAILGAITLSFTGCSLTLPPSKELSLKMAKEQDLNLWCLVVDATAKEKFKDARRLAVTYYNSPKYEGQVQIGPRGEYSIANNDPVFAKNPPYELYIRDLGMIFHPPYCDIPNKKIVKIIELTPQLMKKNYAQTYLRTINNQLVAILNYAVKFYNLKKNPCLAAGTIGKKNADEMNL